MFLSELRLQGEALLTIPPIKETCQVGTQEKALSVTVPQLWNKLQGGCASDPFLVNLQVVVEDKLWLGLHLTDLVFIYWQF